jgi:hypothetical protein
MTIFGIFDFRKFNHILENNFDAVYFSSYDKYIEN